MQIGKTEGIKSTFGFACLREEIMGKNQKMAEEIVKAAGGAGNIKSITNCATRLRMYIKDPSKFDEGGIREIQDVMGFQLSGEQYQVIVGPKAIHLCKEIQDGFGISGGKRKEDNQKTGNLMNRFLETLSGCIAPMVPALAASGLIKVVLTILTMTSLMSADGQTYLLLNTASDAVFYFMPVILAYTSAKRFQCNEILAVVVAGLLLHPNFVDLVAATQESGIAIKFFGLPVTQTSYNGTVIPIILTVWVMSYLEKAIDKFVPETLIHFLRPLLIVFIMSPIALVVTGPLGAVIGEGLAVVLTGIFAKAGWLAIGVTLLFTSFMCMTGMHLALIPIAMTSINTIGYDEFTLVIFLCFTLSQGAAALAVLCKTKNSKLRQLAIPAAISGLFGGTSEPALYGISVRMKTPLYATVIGSTAAGIYAGIVHLKVFAFGLFSILGMPGYMSADYPDNFTHAVITAAIAVFGTMAAVWLIGFDDSVYDEDKNEDGHNSEETTEERIMCDAEAVSVTTGRIIQEKDIKDNVFSTGTLGKAVGILSEDGICYAPVDGEVATVFQTKHAIGIRGDNGMEMLIHVGIDSVNLNGNGFEVYVDAGERVRKGQKLLTYTKDVFRQNNIDETTVLVVCNADDYKAVQNVCESGRIQAGDVIFKAVGREKA